MPHSSAKSGAEQNEEVRLAYVAITRAADQLVLTHAQTRRGRKRTRSPFIEGLILATPPSTMSADYIRDQEIRRESRVQVDPVYESLCAWRTQAGRTASIKPQILCTDEVLRRIASVLPTTIEELTEISGVGKSFALKVGTRILDAIQDGLNQPSV
jgi:superfamily II DNA helicase RecQ